MRITLFFIFCFAINFYAFAQKSRLIVLGDIHYDLLQDHDMDWLSTKPGDLRQVTEEYTKFTKDNWNDFSAILKNRTTNNGVAVKAVIQLGDFSEGLAGTEKMAHQMASNAMKAIDALQMPVPWIIAKGNHDITGPGAVKAIVLCGHLHRYSVVRRNSKYGPVVQVMVNSVIKDRNFQKPTKIITEYGPSLAENVPDWQSETLEARKAMLLEEAKYVTYYKQTDLPGYAMITIDEKKGNLSLEYYAAFAEKPYDTIDLTQLLKP